jgi:WD40 repeat protein
MASDFQSGWITDCLCQSRSDRQALADGTLLTTFAQHTAPLLSVAYTSHARYGSGGAGSDSTLIASASGDRTINLWQPDGATVHRNARDEFAPSLLPMNFLSQGSANKQPFS